MKLLVDWRLETGDVDISCFSLIAKGASCGHGRLSRKSSHGAVITVVIKLTKGDVLYVLVGQEGESACVHNGVETREGLCSQMVRYEPPASSPHSNSYHC